MTTEPDEPLHDGEMPAPYPDDTPGGKQDVFEPEVAGVNGSIGVTRLG